MFHLAPSQELVIARIVAIDYVRLKAYLIDPNNSLAHDVIVCQGFGNHCGRWQAIRIEALAVLLLLEGIQCAIALTCGHGLMWWNVVVVLLVAPLSLVKT